MPKFSSKLSLISGVIAGCFLSYCGVCNIVYMQRINLIGNIFEIILGITLSVHCFDLIINLKRNWFYHKLSCFLYAVRFAWKDKSFKIGVVFCTGGIIVGLIQGIGMTRLVILVAISCLGWGVEIANTSIETLCDIVNPQCSSKVKIVKDCFSAVPIFIYSAYVISWIILVMPSFFA